MTTRDLSLFERQNASLMRHGQKLANYINVVKGAATSEEFETILFNMPNKEFDLVNALDWDQIVENAKASKEHKNVH